MFYFVFFFPFLPPPFTVVLMFWIINGWIVWNLWWNFFIWLNEFCIFVVNCMRVCRCWGCVLVDAWMLPYLLPVTFSPSTLNSQNPVMWHIHVKWITFLKFRSLAILQAQLDCFRSWCYILHFIDNLVTRAMLFYRVENSKSWSYILCYFDIL